MLKRKRPEDDLDRRIRSARQSGRYMILVFQYDEKTSRIDLHRKTERFPISELSTALAMVEEQVLQMEKRPNGQ